jgi:hypothetical protein
MFIVWGLLFGVALRAFIVYCLLLRYADLGFGIIDLGLLIWDY